MHRGCAIPLADMDNCFAQLMKEKTRVFKAVERIFRDLYNKFNCAFPEDEFVTKKSVLNAHLQAFADDYLNKDLKQKIYQSFLMELQKYDIPEYCICYFPLLREKIGSTLNRARITIDRGEGCSLVQSEEQLDDFLAQDLVSKIASLSEVDESVKEKIAQDLRAAIYYLVNYLRPDVLTEDVFQMMHESILAQISGAPTVKIRETIVREVGVAAASSSPYLGEIVNAIEAQIQELNAEAARESAKYNGKEALAAQKKVIQIQQALMRAVSAHGDGSYCRMYHACSQASLCQDFVDYRKTSDGASASEPSLYGVLSKPRSISGSIFGTRSSWAVDSVITALKQKEQRQNIWGSESITRPHDEREREMYEGNCSM